jgi:hypothetical protein
MAVKQDFEIEYHGSCRGKIKFIRSDGEVEVETAILVNQGVGSASYFYCEAHVQRGS